RWRPRPGWRPARTAWPPRRGARHRRGAAGRRRGRSCGRPQGEGGDPDDEEDPDPEEGQPGGRTGPGVAAGPGAAEPEHAPRGGAHVGVDDLAVEEGHDPREREHGTHDEHLLELPDAQPLPDEGAAPAVDEPCLEASAVEPDADG